MEKRKPEIWNSKTGMMARKKSENQTKKITRIELAPLIADCKREFGCAFDFAAVLRLYEIHFGLHRFDHFDGFLHIVFGGIGCIGTRRTQGGRQRRG